MMLHDFWFLLIAVLWIGYFLLEGFDFGVGIVLPFIARNDAERRTLIRTIGPVWDGNEVWVLTAGGATFAAFPEWYATMFSGFYLALFLILVALIIRGVSFEYHSKLDSPTWRKLWYGAIFFGSIVPALLWGVAFGNIVNGVPIDQNMEYTGHFLTLINPYALLAGLMTLTLFTAHGLAYLALKTEGEIRARANRLMPVAGIVAAVAAVAFLGWTQINAANLGHASAGTATLSLAAAVLAAVALLAGIGLNRLGHEGWAFVGTAATIILGVASLFLGLYPNVMVSSTSAAYNLTVSNASSTDLTLSIMAIVAIILVPIVLFYEGWTYWTFRNRIPTPNPPEAGVRNSSQSRPAAPAA
jgi:cytochrome bd ubiquinol oxidase subunit II